MLAPNPNFTSAATSYLLLTQLQDADALGRWKPQVAPQQHGLELGRFAYTCLFFNKCLQCYEWVSSSL